jgi:hypothetical protein
VQALLCLRFGRTRVVLRDIHFAPEIFNDAILKGLVFDDQVMDWIVEALHQSHADEKRFREDAIIRLQEEQRRIQNRLDRLYDDRLDPHRHALVQVAAALRHDASLPFLSVVVSSEIPKEQLEETHSFSTVAEETIIRMSAVDGISALAREGNKQAIETLLSFLKIPSFSIRRASVTGLLEARVGRSLRRKMQSLIPEEQHFIFDLKKTSVREAVQVKDPRRHLAKDAQDFREPKPDPIKRSPGDKDTPSTK